MAIHTDRRFRNNVIASHTATLADYLAQQRRFLAEAVAAGDERRAEQFRRSIARHEVTA